MQFVVVDQTSLDPAPSGLQATRCMQLPYMEGSAMNDTFAKCYQKFQRIFGSGSDQV